MNIPEQLGCAEALQIATDRFTQAVSGIPPGMDFLIPDDEVPEQLLPTQQFMEAHLHDARRKGYNPTQLPQLIKQAASRVATRLHNPDRIIYRELPPEFVSAVQESGLTNTDYYLLLKAHEYGHDLSPYLVNVGQEAAAEALCVSLTDFRTALKQFGYTPDRYQYNLYGRTIEIWDINAGRDPQFVEIMGQTRDKRVEELIPDAYALYIYHLDWANKLGFDASTQELRLEALELFKTSPEFAYTLNNNDIANLTLVMLQ